MTKKRTVRYGNEYQRDCVCSCLNITAMVTSRPTDKINRAMQSDNIYQKRKKRRGGRRINCKQEDERRDERVLNIAGGKWEVADSHHPQRKQRSPPFSHLSYYYLKRAKKGRSDCFALRRGKNPHTRFTPHRYMHILALVYI